MGFTGSQCQTNINECSSDPCQHGGSCFDDVNNYTCQCAPGYAGARCHTFLSERVAITESSAIVFVIVAVVIILVVLTIVLIVICIRKYKNKRRTSNDAGLPSRNETTNTSASGYQHARATNEYEMHDDIGTNQNPPSGSGTAIYDQVVSPQIDDHNGHAATSSSLVYADLEFVTKITKANEHTHSNQGHKNKTPNTCATGPMGDVYAMVHK